MLNYTKSNANTLITKKILSMGNTVFQHSPCFGAYSISSIDIPSAPWIISMYFSVASPMLSASMMNSRVSVILNFMFYTFFLPVSAWTAH